MNHYGKQLLRTVVVVVFFFFTKIWKIKTKIIVTLQCLKGKTLKTVLLPLIELHLNVLLYYCSIIFICHLSFFYYCTAELDVNCIFVRKKEKHSHVMFLKE